MATGRGDGAAARAGEEVPRAPTGRGDAAAASWRGWRRVQATVEGSRRRRALVYAFRAGRPEQRAADFSQERSKLRGLLVVEIGGPDDVPPRVKHQPARDWGWRRGVAQ